MKIYWHIFYRKRLASFASALDHIRLMLGAVRQAFNRNSLKELEEIQRLQDIITLDLDKYFEEIEVAQAQPENADNAFLKKLYGILGHLEHVADEIKKMGEPVRRKIRESTMIGEVELFHLNDLFTQVKGLLRGLADLFHADNLSLKKYLLNQADLLLAHCFSAVTAHETTMTHSFGHPHAFAIYLEILERFKIILNHVKDIIVIMDEKP